MERGKWKSSLKRQGSNGQGFAWVTEVCSQANEAIKAGTVLVNGKSAKAKYAVKEGDVITYEFIEEEVLEYKDRIFLWILSTQENLGCVAVVNSLKVCGEFRPSSWSHVWYLGPLP